MAKGQPRIFKTGIELMNKFNEYINYCKDNQRLANIAGFCVFADIDRETYYHQKEYYFGTFKKIEEKLEDETINAKINDTFKIFYMKNKFNYKDRTEQEVDMTLNEIKVVVDDE